MDMFLRIHDLYLSTSRWKVITRIYSESRIFWKITMWTMKVLFLVVAPFGFFAASWHPFFMALLAITAIWAVSFHKARSEVFAELYRLYPGPMKYFSKNYQFIRCLSFRKRLEADSLAGRVKEALVFADTLNDPRPRSPIMSHPLITFMLGAVLAILSGVAGQWPMKYVVGVILVLMLMVYFSCVILDATQRPTSDLREFRQFLLWVSEQSRTQPLVVEEANSVLE
jgi:low affinity Fe/Cu permease